MNYKKLLKNLIFIFIPLIIIEIFSSVIIYQKEKKIGILFSLFSSNKNYQVNYKIKWDKLTNKIIPGEYENKLKDGSIVRYKINSRGFRSKEFDDKKDADYRIISFGGSTTMGIESADNYTYPAILENIFNEREINVEVLNFGFPSKSLSFIRELFFSEAIDYEPDFITIYSARNSIMYDSIGTKIKVDEIKNQKIEKINLYLINNIMTFRLMFKIYRKILSSKIDTKKIISPYNEEIEHNIFYFTDQYLKTIEQIINFANKSGIKVVLIKQAIFIDPKIQNIIRDKSVEELLDYLQNIRTDNSYELNYHDIFWILTINILNKQLNKFDDYKNVIIVDPVEDLITDKKNFVDYLHLSDNGNEVLANSIYNKLKDKF